MVCLRHSKGAESFERTLCASASPSNQERIAMPNVPQTKKHSLSGFAEKYPVENQLWTAIQQDAHTADDVQVAVAIAMAKDILTAYCPIYYTSFEESFNPSGKYEPYSIMLTTASPTFVKRGSKKRNQTLLGWVYAFLTEVGLSAQLEAFEQAIANNLPV